MLLQQVPQKTATAVSAAIAQCLLPFVMLVHTITADNGKEFAGHQSLAQLLGTLFFFARPYHSWERGLNEHTNGLVRQYFPKSTDLRTIGAQEVRWVQDRLNNRPRKSLGYRTPGGGVPPGAGWPLRPLRATVTLRCTVGCPIPPGPRSHPL